ncbi:hypothetical protein FNV43_RR19965 [Rhamnella rubrinervis]|uniref:S-adenosylmethionine-dependent methyltransferase n=1 Tax=Rhamnella rubrinervis TaxID=2594499 RepID=A0A8K0E5J7_9ROSA|nr:hypothetical protein FNV43_RR19965 [Rhamnella rubrinervis]
MAVSSMNENGIKNRNYYAAGVPGSFYGRLFPEASLRFVHCSYAIQWLSEAPKELMNKSSPAWNKSRIHYANSGDEVVRAYKAQYHKDIEQFLHARAQEIVCGGLMVLIFPGVPNGTHHSQSLPSMSLELLGSCLMDMARKGIVSEEKVDTLNIPIYGMSPQELKEAVEGNGSFSIEIMEELPPTIPDHAVSGGQSKIDTQAFVCHMRAGLEGLFKNHFGERILDVLFESYKSKIEENSSIFMSGKAVNSFVLLKRKLSTSKLA